MLAFFVHMSYNGCIRFVCLEDFMKKYEMPELNVTKFETADVLTTSWTQIPGGDGVEDGGDVDNDFSDLFPDYPNP